ncbi:MAG TPA: tetratricopeptide repeat protein [Gemmatimonadaceae bacterium]|nr:tetratricopeptide repeat protein [Gemmatimonadaceae bacterium]
MRLTLVSLGVTTVAASAVQSPGSQADSVLCDRAINQADGALEELVRQLRASTTPEQQARAAFLRGCERWANGRDGPAAAEFEKAARGDATNPVYRFWLGRVYGEQAAGASPLRLPGLAKRIRDNFERAVAMDPDYLDAREGLVEFYLRAPGIAGGSVQKAKQQAGEVAHRSAYRGARISASIARRTKDTASAVRIYEQLAEQFPDSVVSHVDLIALHVAQRQWPAAWRAVERFEAAFPGRPLARYQVGRVASESGERLEQGQQALQTYLALPPRPNEPTHAAAQWRLGMIREKQGDRQSARAHYETALALDAKFVPARDALARLR